LKLRHDFYSFFPVVVFDPVLSESEKEILSRLNLSVGRINEEGKFPITDNTVFYFPHCPKHLTNNLLWSNWKKTSLSKVFLLSNSFERIITNLPDRLVKQEGAEFILRVSGCVKETPVKNNYHLNDVFNDTSIHSFPEKLLSNKKDPEFWKRGEAPIYQEQDREFVTNKV
jgi:hypothetical protein